jgi:hypothetical protein
MLSDALRVKIRQNGWSTTRRFTASQRGKTARYDVSDTSCTRNLCCTHSIGRILCCLKHWSGLVRYLPPFEALKPYLTISTAKGKMAVSCNYENLVQLIRRIIIDVPVDEPWYLERYPDVAEAIRQGIVASAKSHFVNDGYLEGRLPFPIQVDERYYLTQNPGVAEHVRKGALASGQQHFDENGYQEGRLPFGL